MSYDKHDLFRNAIPGYVFLTAVFSFYVVDGGSNSITDHGASLIGVVAGFPIGFLIYSIYRFINQTGCGRYASEQSNMEHRDVSLVRRIVTDKKRINNALKKFPDNGKDKALSNILTAVLMNSKNEKFEERCSYLMSLIHSLGASVTAVILGVGTIAIPTVIFKAILLFDPYYLTEHDSQFQFWTVWTKKPEAFQIVVIVTIIWFVLAAVLWILRNKTFDTYIISRQVFLQIEAEAINKAF